MTSTGTAHPFPVHPEARPARRRALCRGVALGLVLAVAAGLTASVAGPVSASNASGPTLRVSRSTALKSLACHGNLARSRNTPVLFLHGTTSNSASDWSWNWNRALGRRHWAYCDLDFPDSGNGDIQVSAEYVVRAIRSMAARRHGRIDLVGHSQGGMIGRWALKFWPDTRRMVADYVSLSASNHGTDVFSAQCTAGCDAASWQQRTGSRFLRALNRGHQTWKQVSYTAISTNLDEVVVPSTSAWLPKTRNVTDVAVQDLCPTEAAEHFGMSSDNAAWLIGLDALTHPGPARLTRVPTTTCGRPTMPAVNLTTYPEHIAAALAQTASSSAAAPSLTAEPPLRRYARIHH